MDTLTVMIVDDDLSSQQVLKHHLNTISGVVIIAVASGADEAYRMILEKVPDIIFLDVEMPGKSGFDLVSDLYKLKIHPCVIFQTAYDKYAIEAIRAAAFDYLLKPVDREELLEAIAKFKASRNQDPKVNPDERRVPQIDPIRRIRLNSKKGFILVDPDDIHYCIADWNYTDVYYGNDQKETLCINLRKFYEQLPAQSFFRINRSTVINLKYLSGVSRMDHQCTLNIHGKILRFSTTREHIAELEERLG